MLALSIAANLSLLVQGGAEYGFPDPITLHNQMRCQTRGLNYIQLFTVVIRDTLQLKDATWAEVSTLKDACVALSYCYLAKLPNLKVENSAQTAFSFSPIRYLASLFIYCIVQQDHVSNSYATLIFVEIETNPLYYTAELITTIKSCLHRSNLRTKYLRGQH